MAHRHTPSPYKSIKDVGSHIWITLHAFAESFPNEPTSYDVSNMKRFIDAFQVQLYNVCSKCGLQLQIRLLEAPLNFTDKRSLTNSIFELHNYVNSKIGKPVLEKCVYNSVWQHFDPSTCTDCAIAPPTSDLQHAL